MPSKKDLAEGLAGSSPTKPVIKRGQGVQLSTDARSQKRTNAKSHHSDDATNVSPKRVNRGYKLREDLIVACKVLAAQRGLKLYEVMETALAEYLERETGKSGANLG